LKLMSLMTILYKNFPPTAAARAAGSSAIDEL
jgi:hypothetical protein